MGKRPSSSNGNPNIKKHRSNPETSSSSTSGDENEPVAGIIESINLKNFMNHASLKFDFKPETNFVTGRNGTGKSALLTGLVVGLGGKASATNRGGHLSGFIKDGKQVSEIVIKLRNRGEDAYKPQVFGETITVERRLSRKGGSDYKIKSANGSIVSTTKGDLTAILDYFNIQIENPVVVLNQETSKNFLCSKNPADRYKFFSKATQIEAMEAGYGDAEKNLNITMDSLRVKESHLPILEAEVKSAQDKANALESLDKLKDRLRKKFTELAWAGYIEKENTFTEMSQKVTKLQRTRPNYQNKVAEAQAAVEEADNIKKEIEGRIKQIAEESPDIEQNIKFSKQVVQERTRLMRDKEEGLKQVSKELKRLKVEKREIDDRIKDLQAALNLDKSSKLEEHRAKLERMDKARIEMQQKLTDAKSQLQVFSRDITKLREEKQEIIANNSEHERLKSKTQQVIQGMERSRNNKVARFGKHYPDLVEEIKKLQKAGKFRSKVYGPIGQHIKVIDMNYALAVEKALGGLAYSFFVETGADFNLLKQICSRVYGTERKPDIVQGVFSSQRYSTDTCRAQTNHKTLLDVITTDDDVVYNCIVDQLSPYSTLLILDGKEARALMSKSPPKNANQCFDSNGDQIYPTPMYRVYSNRNDRTVYLSADVDQDIQREKQRLNELISDMSESQAHINTITSRISKIHNNLNNQKDVVKKFETSLRQLNVKIENQKAQMVEDEAPPGDLDALVSDAEGLESEIAQVQSNYDACHKEYSTAKKSKQEADLDLNKIKQLANDIRSNTEPLKMELTEADNDIETAKDTLKHYQKELKTYDLKLKAEEEQLNTFKTNKLDLLLTEMKDKGLTERVNTRKTTQTIGVEIEKIKKQLEQEQALRGDSDQIREELTTKTKELKRIRRDVTACKTYSKAMNQALKLRWKAMDEVKQYTASLCKMHFAEFLIKRNYEGKLSFNHKDKTLSIQVEPAKLNSLMDKRDLKGLSGGEKSFSTLCFMLSLWQDVNCPFRCMDEFDVFMDMVNRKVSLTMILKFAEHYPRHQFVLLTPQDTSQVETTCKVHIFRMPDPDRGQKRTRDEAAGDDGE